MHFNIISVSSLNVILFFLARFINEILYACYATILMIIRVISITPNHFIRLKVFAAVIMNNAIFRDVTPCGTCKNRFSEECGASTIRVIRIRELGTALAVTNNRGTLMMAALRSCETSVLTRATRHIIPADGILHFMPVLFLRPVF
jgi:hypothetical protein